MKISCANLLNKNSGSDQQAETAEETRVQDDVA
jgi:hypothetical protein